MLIRISNNEINKYGLSNNCGQIFVIRAWTIKELLNPRADRGALSEIRQDGMFPSTH